MTLRQLLDDLHRLGVEDGAMDAEVGVEDVLDYCAVLGLSGASEIYLKRLRKVEGAEGSD